MRLPIDTQAISFGVARASEPVVEFETKAPRLDAATNQPLFNAYLFVSGDGTSDSITVKVVGEPKALPVFTPVRVVGLVASTWDIGDKHGVSFRAERIESLVAKAPS
jgi:hypothetical protein